MNVVVEKASVPSIKAKEGQVRVQFSGFLKDQRPMFSRERKSVPLRGAAGGRRNVVLVVMTKVIAPY